MVPTLTTTERHAFDRTHRQPRTTARRGFQHVSEVIERLIRFYELQSDMNAARESSEALGECSESGVPATQATFAWYQS